ncbi:unnamed protein product [Callosobruchus maculatus]|uniref:Origin recognition complex subunit 4 n=1 Tax=Callosobruchus maculatus TaxID=64391 RepID=A0A653BJA7_CALMS|nr:unnamed protein product [Callosobruchus maculatus]
MENNFNHIIKHLKQNILKNRTCYGYEKEEQQIYDLLERTLDCGESNSALLIGPRRCGKTLLVNKVLEQLQLKDNFQTDCILVKLNGLIHTDDRLALKSTTSQMQLDNVVDGKVFGTFAENLAFLLECLRTGDKCKSKSVIFILEAFDLFCSHHNQTLLYNLFDVSQSAQAPICILGITCRLDVIELLEKRVKSRFSHRQIFLLPHDSQTSKSDALEDVLRKIEDYLRVPEGSVKLKTNDTLTKQWNKSLTNLLKDKKFKNVIQRLIDIDNSESMLKDFLVKVIFQLNGENLTVDIFQKQLNMLEEDDMIKVLQDLTVLELCLIISMKHHIEIYDNNPMNFEMIYNRFIKFANANAGVQNFQRAVILKAFEHIQGLELISMLSNTTSKVQKEYQFFKLLVTPRQILEAVKKSSGLPTEVTQWAHSSLT